MTNSNFTHLECTYCSNTISKDTLINVCLECGKPIFAHYDLEKAASELDRKQLRMRESTLWRYREVLPIEIEENIVSLGEGWTPLVQANRLGSELGFSRLF